MLHGLSFMAKRPKPPWPPPISSGWVVYNAIFVIPKWNFGIGGLGKSGIARLSPGTNVTEWQFDSRLGLFRSSGRVDDRRVPSQTHTESIATGMIHRAAEQNRAVHTDSTRNVDGLLNEDAQSQGLQPSQPSTESTPSLL